MRPVAASLCVVALLLGCAGSPKVVKAPLGPYGDALGASTRSGGVYDGFESRLFVIATYDDEALQLARRNELSRMFNEPYEASVARIAPIADAVTGMAFVVAASAPDRTLVDLDAPTSAWTVRLGEGPASVAPVSIRRIDVSPVHLATLYPWVEKPWVAYRVVFDVPPVAAPLLVVSGAYGRLRLQF